MRAPPARPARGRAAALTVRLRGGGAWRCAAGRLREPCGCAIDRLACRAVARRAST
ncbi:MAG: hypothetical protein MZV64_48740 [Ignavibacteriales bacterium]|nr:hypothetical protein [Ignavibacteriales bacterium]